jgi:hypothetical protein
MQSESTETAARGLLIIQAEDGQFVVIRDDGNGPAFEKVFPTSITAMSFALSFFDQARKLARRGRERAAA